MATILIYIHNICIDTSRQQYSFIFTISLGNNIYHVLHLLGNNIFHVLPFLSRQQYLINIVYKIINHHHLQNQDHYDDYQDHHHVHQHDHHVHHDHQDQRSDRRGLWGLRYSSSSMHN